MMYGYGVRFWNVHEQMHFKHYVRARKMETNARKVEVNVKKNQSFL